MELNYKTILYEYSYVSGLREKYELENTDWCCGKLETHIEEWNYTPIAPVVAFLSGIDGPGVVLLHSEVDYDGGLCSDPVEINHCPWCGEEIELVETDRVVEFFQWDPVEETVERTKTETKYVPEEEYDG